MIEFPDELISLLANAGHVAVLTGAGISAESGVPTFREAQTGLWERYNPEELATPRAFIGNPKLVWEWYAWRRELIAAVKPNPAHYALVEMARHVPQFTLITQNIDSLHQRAGSQDVIELHGNIARTKCFDCGTKLFDQQELELDLYSEDLPRCDYCGGLLRPDVVWFGETLPREALNRAYDASRGCDLFFSIGTSALVQPAASLPTQAMSQGIPTVEVNPMSTPISSAMNFVLNGPAGEILPALVERTWPE
ncbi:MAG: SIR2 family NAD-dependent protein deacylase [Candidatus Promineifilaceae bacterium]